MDNLLSFVRNYLDGGKVYPSIRRALHVLLSVSIASFLFEKIYFKYDWIDLSYKPLMNFFIKGDFFIPLSLFLVVHFSLLLISVIFFYGTTTIKSTKILEWIYKLSITKKDVRTFHRQVKATPLISYPISEDTWINIYNHLRTTISAKQLQSFQQSLDKQKLIIENNFHLIFKLVVVETIYFTSIKHFGWLLYTLVILVSLIGLMFLWWSYLFLDTGPALIRKFDDEIQQLLQNRKLQADENQANKE